MTPKKTLLIYIFLITLVAVIQTNLLLPLKILGGRPDYTLLLIVFFSHQLGSFKGKFIGFYSGLLMDVLGLAPLGFHSFLYTVVGHFFGKTKGKVYIDILTLPLLLALLASVMKIIVSFVLTVIFDQSRWTAVFSVSTLLEVGLNILMSPVLFAVLKLFRLVNEHETHMV